MESPYQKMYVLPAEEYHRLTMPKQDPKMMQLERELHDLKEQQNLPPDQLHKVQSYLYSRGRDMKSKPTKESSRESKESGREPKESSGEPTRVKWIEQSIHRLPKHNQQRALQLLNFLINREIGWNSEGEIRDVNGDVLPNSNIVDLINYMTLSHRRKYLAEPEGLYEFIELLQAANMPNNMLGLIGQEAMKKSRGSFLRTGPELVWHSLK